ncbi:MAG: flagellar export chaperone FlgN [Deltaproteobacteria bacterium]|nr:flagellar export chaperone FlgN [Deltaproteobacteria bacterium]
MQINRQVYDSLHEINAVLGELCTLALQERQDIVEINLAGLDERRIAIEKLLGRTGDLNAQIASQIGSACDALGLIGEKTLSSLITDLLKPERDSYSALQKSVRANSVAAKNNLLINQALMKDSLAFTNYSLQTFTGILKASSSGTYGQQGRFIDTIDQPRIICKEI